jgi:hypothetical protein
MNTGRPRIYLVPGTSLFFLIVVLAEMCNRNICLDFDYDYDWL